MRESRLSHTIRARINRKLDFHGLIKILIPETNSLLRTGSKDYRRNRSSAAHQVRSLLMDLKVTKSVRE